MEARRAEFGRNVLPSAPPPSPLAIVGHQLRSPLIYILLAAAGVALALRDVVDAGFILAVVFLNTTLGAFQEWRAEHSAAALQQLIALRVRVLRDGHEEMIDAAELVPDDIVRVESGQRVPADIALREATGLSVDESLLTGESVAVSKRAGVLPGGAPADAAEGMLYAGSTIMSGRGLGVVTATGARTQVGGIARVVSGETSGTPPLVLRLERFARQLSVIVLAACAVLVVVGVTRGMPWLEVFLVAVALAVSAIPEGLPVAVTVALSVATRRMAQRHVIVRRLTAVEGLGSCTYIASDKTGTLTVNRQTVQRVVLADGTTMAFNSPSHVDAVADAVADPSVGTSRDATQIVTAVITRVARVAAVCNDAHRHVHPDGRVQEEGDAVDIALLTLAELLGDDPKAVRAHVEVVHTVPFESEHAFAAVYIRHHSATVALVKGAPEVLLPHCQHAMTASGEPVPFDMQNALRHADALTAGGFRVLALADATVHAPLPAATALPALTLLGFVALIDPPRLEARDAVDRCTAAGIRVAMVTGDHPRTAFAIAQQLGIAAHMEEVVTGAQLADTGTPESPAFDALVARGRVFARVSPLQKLQVIEALRRLGHYVAVTGDGVNDAPALKRANIGVAMGSGSDIAKDTASLIVTDDNFASIEAGVEEGRFAYDNIRKVTLLAISTGAAEVLLLVLALASGLPLPLQAVQLLWLNLVTNGIQDVALAFEAGEPDVMQRAPRRPTEGIFNRRMIEQSVVGGGTMALTAFSAWALLLQSGMEESVARNLVLLLFVLMQNLHVFSCRSERRSLFRIPFRNNRIVVLGVLAAQGIHLLAMHLPPFQTLLKVAPVSAGAWGQTVLAALTVVLAMELYKWMRPPSIST